MVVILAPSACTVNTVHAFTACPPIRMVHAPQLARVAAHVRAREPDRLADVMDEQEARLDLVALVCPLIVILTWCFHEWTSWV